MFLDWDRRWTSAIFTDKTFAVWEPIPCGYIYKNNIRVHAYSRGLNKHRVYIYQFLELLSRPYALIWTHRFWNFFPTHILLFISLLKSLKKNFRQKSLKSFHFRLPLKTPCWILYWKNNALCFQLLHLFRPVRLLFLSNLPPHTIIWTRTFIWTPRAQYILSLIHIWRCRRRG